MKNFLYLIKHYIIDRRQIIIGTLFLTAASFGVFMLFDFPTGPLCYCHLLLWVTGLGLFGISDFVRYCKQIRSFQALLQLCPRVPEPIMAKSSSLPLSQQMLIEAAESLRIRCAELEQQLVLRQDELIEYYTLWGHQIKTPLAAMGAILQTRPSDVQALRQELFNTERYVDMVLGYLRIWSMSSDLRLRSLAVRPIAARAAKKFAPQFIYKHLSLELGDFDNKVITDEKWLLFVLEQLISNAVKYTEKGKISINMDSRQVLTISDQGIGIDQADLPRIFERGFTGKNGRSVGSCSTGLGLYLTQKIVEKLQNRIEVESAPGEGTKVRLYLDRPAPPRD